MQEIIVCLACIQICFSNPFTTLIFINKVIYKTFVLKKDTIYFFVKHSFIHSGYFYTASSSSILLRGTPNYSIAVSELTCKTLQTIASEGLAQGPYVGA